jgi:NAD(P)-dependent dehydrogenase (short-subunit alcohol dehydrogenase family)
MSSLAGRFGYPNRVAYSTTKWGLVGFAKTLSMELGPFGITTNTIHPGAVDGPRIQAVFEGRAKVSGRTAAEELDSALANQSVKKLIDPDDIAALAVFLAGPHARTISGQMFPIDGDSKSST